MESIHRLVSRFNYKMGGAGLLLACWLVIARYRRKNSTVEAPLLVLHGPPGSGKTTLAREIGRIVNDDSAFEVDTPAAKEEDFWLRVSKPKLVVLDNLDQAVPRYLAGAVARAITGGQYTRRTLYENADETTFTAEASIVVTTIVTDLVRADILDRSIPVALLPIERFRPRLVMDTENESLRTSARKEADRICERLAVRVKGAGEAGVSSGELRTADFAWLGRIVAEESGVAGAVEQFDAALQQLPAHREALAMDADPLLAGLLLVAEDTTLAGKALTGAELLDAIRERLGLKDEFDHALRDPQKFGIIMRQLRDRAAGMVSIETQRTNAGVRYAVRRGR